MTRQHKGNITIIGHEDILEDCNIAFVRGHEDILEDCYIFAFVQSSDFMSNVSTNKETFPCCIYPVAQSLQDSVDR